MTDALFDNLRGDIENFLSSDSKPVRFTNAGGAFALELDAHAVNLQQLAGAVFTAFGDLLDAIPPELMAMLDVGLTHVEIVPAEGRFNFTVLFDQTWGIAPIFEVKKPEVTFYYYDGDFAGVIQSKIHVGLDLDAEISFPGTTIRAFTLPGEEYALADLLAFFAVDASGVGPFQDVKLSSATVTIDTMLETAAVFVAFEDVIELGVFQMNELILDLRYHWDDDDRGLSGSAQATITLDIPDHEIVVSLRGAHEVGAGWVFAAEATLADLTLADLVGWIAGKFGVNAADLPVPESLLDIGARSLNITYATQDKSFTFDVLLELGDTAEMELTIAVHDQADSHPGNHRATAAPATGSAAPAGQKAHTGSQQIDLLGTLYLNRGTGNEIDLLAIFDKTGSASNFVAVFHPITPRKMSILDLVAPVIDVSPEAVPDLEIDLASIIFAHVGAPRATAPPPAADIAAGQKKRLNQAGTNILSIDLGGGLDLSGLGHLPLVGSTIGDAASLHLAFQLTYATGGGLGKDGAATADPAQHINDLLQAYNVALPAQVPAGFSIKTELRLGADEKPLDVVFGGSSNVVASKQAGTLQDSALSTPAPAAATLSSALTTGAGDDAVTWYPIEKTFGPIHVSRVGFKYVDQKVTAYLDASLSLSVLSITLMGLGASFNFPVSDLDKLDPSFALDGLGLEFKRGNIELSGAFLRGEFLDPATNATLTSYNGAVTIRTATVTLSAVGSFAQFSDGSPSGFIYGVLNYPIGGPAAFFVLGLAAGFGYNRDLILPDDLGTINTHWLVRDALDSAGGAGAPKALPASTGSAAAGQPGADTNAIAAKLRQVRASVPPRKGQNFLAAGIRFTTFQLLDSFVLVTVAFGQHFEVNVIGLTTLRLPPKAPVTPVAVVQLAIRARFAPDEGEISVRGQLTGASYLFSTDNHLTGGFAFASWFKGPHAGDFVITFGGYHPNFQRPAHYPDVPRLGFNWVVNDHLTIKGGIYLALTPGMIMAGGALSATWNSDDVTASFLVGADFMIKWKPFHYDIKAYISIHAEATIDLLLGRSRKSFDASADLHIWGPDFGGHAAVSVTVFGVHVHFGIDFGATPAVQETISWDEFRESFLDGKPKPQAAVDGNASTHQPAERRPLATLAISKGLNRELGDASALRFSLQPKEIEIRVDTVIPFKTVNQQPIIVGDAAAAPADGQSMLQPLVDAAIHAGHQAMMAVPVGQRVAQSDLDVRIRSHAGEDVARHFEVFPVPKPVPTALWGARPPEMNDQQRVVALVSGVQIRARRHPEEQAESTAVARKDMQYHELPVTAHLDWATAAQGWDVVSEADSAYRQMLDPTAVAQRRDLLTAFGFLTYQENIQQVDPLVTNSQARG